MRGKQRNMARALDLRLKQGDSVLLNRPIIRELPNDSLALDMGFHRRPIGYSFHGAIRAEVVDIDKKGSTTLKYENGGIKEVSPQFTGFSRERTGVQKVTDFFKWAYHFCRPILLD